MKKLYNRFIAWLFLETPKTDVNNGLVNKETPYERKVTEMTATKKAPVKKTTAKKAPVKKTAVKKTTAKKTTTKKK